MVIGAVSYLNTKPLIDGLEESSERYELQLDLPSRLADRLAQGDFDVALIPVIEAIQDPRYVIVSDVCIACRGPVWSVKVMSRVAPEKIKTLALDEGSRTSQTLARVLLAERYGASPKTQALAMSDDWKATSCDAALIIGDRAMNADDESFPFSLDLGTEWYEWTGLPFVFAVWAATPKADHAFLHETLNSSYELGQTRLTHLAAENAWRYSLTEQECFRYLDHFIHYDLGRDEKLGMQKYFDLAAKHSLIPDSTSLNFFDSQ